jgi:hypothetical protein
MQLQTRPSKNNVKVTRSWLAGLITTLVAFSYLLMGCDIERQSRRDSEIVQEGGPGIENTHLTVTNSLKRRVFYRPVQSTPLIRIAKPAEPTCNLGAKCAEPVEAKVVNGVLSGPRAESVATRSTVAIYLSDDGQTGRFACSGTVVGGQWILTAMHCVFETLRDGTLKVLGPNRLFVAFNENSPRPEDFRVVEQVSPYFSLSEMPENCRTFLVTQGQEYCPQDLALLKVSASYRGGVPTHYLANSLLDSFSAGMTAPSGVGPLPPANPNVRLAGFGFNRFDSNSQQFTGEIAVLREGDARVDFFSSDELIYETVPTANQSIAAGDSGGPNFYRPVNMTEYFQAGVNSYGYIDGSGRAGYVNVAKFLPWLRSIVGNIVTDRTLRIAKPVYRTYAAYANPGFHDYTASIRDYFSEYWSRGWTLEGLNFWAFSGAHANSNLVPIYHVKTPNSTTRYLTLNKAEHDVLVNAGWISMGVLEEAYLLPPVSIITTPGLTKTGCKPNPKSGLVEVFHNYNPNNGEHFFPMSKGECDYLLSIGWEQHSSLGYGPIP